MRTLVSRQRTLHSILAILVPAILVAAASACSPTPGADAGEAETRPQVEAQKAPPNTLTPEEREAGWRLLFDGESLDGWRGFRMDSMPDGWKVVDGTLARTGPGGDIITRERFEDFELSLEWRVEEGGNSGVFYLVTEEVDRIFEGAPEMQVLDDAAHPDGRSPLTSAGANYGLHPAPDGVVRPAGEWNRARIVVRDRRVEHWLNGRRVVEYELGSEDWQRRVAESKFVQWPLYGQARRGHIGLQDHGDPVWFRSIKIREF